MIAVCAWYCGRLESAVWPSTADFRLLNLTFTVISSKLTTKIKQQTANVPLGIDKLHLCSLLILRTGLIIQINDIENLAHFELALIYVKNLVPTEQ